MNHASVDDWFLTEPFFRDPYPFYRELLAKTPVVWSSKLHAWLVCPFDAVKDGLHDSELFGSKGRIEAAAGSLTAEQRAENSRALGCLQAMMTFQDGASSTTVGFAAWRTRRSPRGEWRRSSRRFALSSPNCSTTGLEQARWSWSSRSPSSFRRR